MILATVQFGSIAPAINPLRLSEGAAQTAENCILTEGGLKPLKGTAAVAGVTLGRAVDGTIKTIYRYGQELDSETQSWLQSTKDVSFVRGMVNGDVNEITYMTGDGKPRIGDATLITSGDATRFPGAWYELGMPLPDAPDVLLGGTATDPGQTPEYVSYVTQWENSWGQAGPYSGPSAVVETRTGNTVTVTPDTIPVGYSGDITLVRIFRTVAGSYFLVGEVSPGATFVDDLSNVEAFELDLTLMLAPPQNMHSMVSLPNGSTAGLSGIDLWVSPPYRNYGYPTAYRTTVDSPGVGLGVVDQNIVVLTRADPYIVYGGDPSTLAPIRLDFPHSCVSRRSIVSGNGGVFYASPDGLCFVGPDSRAVLTEGRFNRETWNAAFKPESIHAYWHDSKYIAFYDTGSKQGCFILDTRSEGNPITTCSVYATAGYVDKRHDALFLVVGGVLHKWAAGSAMTLKYKGKRHELPYPMCFSVGQVNANAYPLTARFYADGSGTAFHTQTVTSSKAFRLPRGTRYTTVEVEVESANPIVSIYLATTAQELKGVT